MDAVSLSVAASSFHLNSTYVAAASEQCVNRQRRLQSLLAHKRLPTEGWSEQHIVDVIQQLAALDSNNNNGRLSVLHSLFLSSLSFSGLFIRCPGGREAAWQAESTGGSEPLPLLSCLSAVCALLAAGCAVLWSLSAV